MHCDTKLFAHCGAASFSDLEFILIDHVFGENGPFFSVGWDDLVPPFESFHAHSSAFLDLDERVSDEVRLEELAVFFGVGEEEYLDFLNSSQHHLNGVTAVHTVGDDVSSLDSQSRCFLLSAHPLSLILTSSIFSMISGGL